MSVSKKKQLLSADKKLNDLSNIKEFINSANSRLDAITSITRNSHAIAADAVTAMICENQDSVNSKISLNTKNIYFVGYLSKNKITNNLKMNKPYSFCIDQMNGIVEDTYAKIINECENLKKNTNCPNEQVVALLSVIASNYTTRKEKSEN